MFLGAGSKEVKGMGQAPRGMFHRYKTLSFVSRWGEIVEDSVVGLVEDCRSSAASNLW